MAFKVMIPKIDSLQETVKIEKWLVKEGDSIKKGDVLFELETEKAILEVESKFSGTLLKIFIPSGKDVPIKRVAAIIGNKGENISDID